MAERSITLRHLQERLAFAALLVLVTFVSGVLGYHVIGGDQHTWMDATYMTANVLTTAGFREAIDVSESNSGMLFTVVLLIFGAGTVVYATSIITAFVVEGDLTQGFRRHRMRRAIRDMKGHHIVCGAGATGHAVLRELVKTERSVVAVELDGQRVKALEQEMPELPVVQGDFTDDQVLLEAGIARASGIVICTAQDKDSLVTTITARQLNPSVRIIARAANERSLARLRQAGADGVVSPALIGGMRMASELVRPSVVSFLDMMLRDTHRNLRIEEVPVPAQSAFAGRSVGELDPHVRANCLLLAVRTSPSEYSYNPPDSTIIAPGMVLIVMGDPEGMRSLARLLAEGTPALGVAVVS
ncbi:MAG: hypothetical protein JWO05_2425 [Gemmatimonadetes bacterium]|nr:hypothetical protein [Gemmatimonadota bacterium]